MKLIGLTGGVATGKTTVARMFRDLGVPTIDTDEIAHEVIKKGRPAYKKLLKLCGRAILKRNGEIDRTRLAKLIFAPKGDKLRRKVEGFIHPQVWKKIVQSSSRFVVIEVPLLFEAGWDKKVAYTIVVTCPKKIQLKRCQKGFASRIKTQMPLSKKSQLADFIIDNSGSSIKTKRQVKALYRQLVQSFDKSPPSC